VPRKQGKFDAAYYAQFYGARRSRVQGRREVARLATVVVNVIEATYGPLSTALDVGAGTGLWRDWFAARRPNVRYRSTDVSAYACRQFGHERRDITQWKAREVFDLVVCQSVLPYLSRVDASKAIRNLAAMTGAFLYLEAVTDHDLASVSDPATDGAMKGYPGEWYRQKLDPHFIQIGFGLWARRGAPIMLWELERGRD
jgi:hypothetical protein